MAKKSKFLVLGNIIAQDVGRAYDDVRVFTNPENIIEINPPVGMITTRVTIQTTFDLTATDVPALLISDHRMNIAQDGYLIVGNYNNVTNRPIPASYTFENFADEGFSQTIYLANVTGATTEINCSIIFEGYVNE
jgi:hypothetical protein